MANAPLQDPAAPVFTDEQWHRLCSYGTAQTVGPGTRLLRAGATQHDMILVEGGTIAILRAPATDGSEVLVTQYGPREFCGEMDLLTGQTGHGDAYVCDAAIVHRIKPIQFRRLMAAEPDLSDLILRALVARRRNSQTGEAAHGIEVLAGAFSAEGLALRTYLDRQQLAYTWTRFDSQWGTVLARTGGITADDLPAVLTAAAVIRQATPARVADLLGLGHQRVGRQTLDVVVIGGGPGGLAAAVYAASEGLRTLLVDAVAAGGQAAASSRIENYLGFTSGLSGADLISRGVIQAQKFGAQIASPTRATRVDTTTGRLRVMIEETTAIETRAIVVASGARYLTLPLTRWAEFEGTGIYYAATELEARRCGPAPVAVIGGANSAGQAALFLADRGNLVDLIVRGASLISRMSAYLADRIVAHPAINVHTGTEVIDLDGDDYLRRITTATTSTDGCRIEANHECSALFCFIGAVPATDWLTDITLDDNGFILTDARLGDSALGAHWEALGRRPLPFETSTPAVLAAGDVRAGSMKRVAAAVGEGASAICSVHAILSGSVPSGRSH
jgi:thioredoxin reductase (NADPH)